MPEQSTPISWHEVLVDFQNAAELFQGLSTEDKEKVAAVINRDYRPAINELLKMMDSIHTDLNIIRQSRCQKR